MAKISKAPDQAPGNLAAITRNNWSFSTSWKVPAKAVKDSNSARWSGILVRLTLDRKYTYENQAEGVTTSVTVKTKAKKAKKGKKKKTTKYKSEKRTNVEVYADHVFYLANPKTTSFSISSTNDNGKAWPAFARKNFYGGWYIDRNTGKITGGGSSIKLDAIVFEVQGWNKYSPGCKKKKNGAYKSGWWAKGYTQAAAFKFKDPNPKERPEVTCAGRNNNHQLYYKFVLNNDQATNHEVQAVQYNLLLAFGLYADADGPNEFGTTVKRYIVFDDHNPVYVSHGDGTKNWDKNIDPNYYLRDSKYASRFKGVYLPSVLELRPNEYIETWADGVVYGVAGDKTLKHDEAKGEGYYLLAYPFKTQIKKVEVKIDADIYRINFKRLEDLSGGKRKSDKYVLQMLRNHRPDGSDEWDDDKWDASASATQDNDWTDVSTIGQYEYSFSINKQQAKPEKFARTYFRIKAENEDFTPIYSEPFVNPDFMRVPSAKAEKVKFLEAISTDDGKSIKVVYGWHVTYSNREYLVASVEAGSNPKEMGLYEVDSNSGEYKLTEDTSPQGAKTYYRATAGDANSDGTEISWSPDEYAWRSTQKPETLNMADKDFEDKSISLAWTTDVTAPRPEWAGTVDDGKRALRFDLDGEDVESNLVDKIGTVYIRGLSEGTPYYLKLRRYLEEGRETISYGEYIMYTGSTLNPGEDAEALAPYTKPKDLKLVAPQAIPEGEDFSVTWTFESTGEQSRWDILYGKEIVTYPEETVADGANPTALELYELIPGGYSITSDESPIVGKKYYFLAPGSYTLTEDAVPVEGKVYYSYSGNAYVEAVVAPEANPAESNLYEYIPDSYEEQEVNSDTDLQASPYYEFIEDSYVLTQDPSAVQGKNYYRKNSSIVIQPDKEDDPTKLSLPTPLYKLHLDSDEKESEPYGGADKRGYAVIEYDDIEDLLIDGHFYMVVRVWTTGEASTSQVADIMVRKKPMLRFLDFNKTLTEQPMSITMLADSAALNFKVTVDAEHGSEWRPDGIFRQLEGETIYTEYLTTLDKVDLADPVPVYGEAANETEEAPLLTTMLYSYTYEFPSDLELIDGGAYEVRVVGIDRESGLTTEEDFTGNGLSPLADKFRVEWSHQASEPSKWSYITKTRGKLGVDIHIKPGPGVIDSDVCDIYRVTPDGAVLVKKGQAFNTVVTDEYAPFSKTALTRYRLCTRTKDGDIAYIDVGYRLKNHVMRFDWGVPGDNPPADTPIFLELPYNLKYSDAYEKNFESRLHMDGLYQGYWRDGISRKNTMSTDIIRLENPREKEAIRALARYAGPVFVRLPDGCAFAANVKVTGMPNDYDSLVMNVKLEAEEIALPEQFMIPIGLEADSEGEAQPEQEGQDQQQEQQEQQEP